MKRMLFNATQSEELRVATINDSKLEDLDFERGNREQRKSNIYKAVVTRVEPSLEAAFVNYGVDRHGFLPFKEIAPEFYSKKTRKKDVSIKDVIKEGQELIIQVSKEERGNKGAALTSYLSLAGRYIVLMPNNNGGGGISRRVEGEERFEFKEILSKLKVKKGMSVIGRTAGIGATLEEIQWDLDYLTQLFDAIAGAADAQPAPFLIYQESNLVVRAIRDYFHEEIEEILIDKKDIFDQAHQFISHVMPTYADRVKFYEDEISLFTKYGIENQIESAFLREVQLPSGGVIVIDHTEALVSVDVNSSRSTKGRSIENTALSTNLEAADEVAKQLRLRDIGGLIVIDFIDMENLKNQKEVENRIKDALKLDKARIQTSRISRFGLLELSRQRLKPSIGEAVNGVCSRCQGTGRVRDIQSTSLYLLRMIQEEANKDSNQIISIQIPIEVATLLLNEKRKDIANIESKTKNEIIIIPNKFYEIPKYSLERSTQKASKASYAVVEPPLESIQNNDEDEQNQKVRLEPVVKAIVPSQRNTKSKNNKTIFGFFKNLIGTTEDSLVEESKETKTEERKNTEKPHNNRRPNNRRPNNNKRRNNRDNLNSEQNTQARNSNRIQDKNEITQAKKEDIPAINESLTDKKVKPNTVKETKTKPKRKVEKLEKVDLSKVGLKLVETKASLKSKNTKTKLSEKKEVKTKKKASWQNQPKKKVGNTKLVMVETKKEVKTKKIKKTSPSKK